MIKLFKAKLIKEQRKIIVLTNEDINVGDVIIPIDYNGKLELVTDLEEFNEFDKIKSNDLYVTTKTDRVTMILKMEETMNLLKEEIVEDTKNVSTILNEIEEISKLKGYVEYTKGIDELLKDLRELLGE